MKNTTWIAVVMAFAFCAAQVSFAGTSGPSPIPPPPTFFINSTATTLCTGQTDYVPLTIVNGGVPANLTLGADSLAGPQMQDIKLSLLNSQTQFYTRNSVSVNGSIAPENAITVNVPVFIGSNSPQLMTLGASITYYYYTFYTDAEVKNLTFSTISCPLPLSASVSPKTLDVGQAQNITVNITNTGPVPLNSITLGLTYPGSDMVAISGQNQYIPSLAPNASARFNVGVFVSKNASQTFGMNATLSFYSGDQLEQLSKNIEVLTAGTVNLTQTSLTISPSVPSPGSIFSISFVLTDTGSAGLSSATVSAIAPEGFGTIGANSEFIGDLASGGETPVTLTLEPNSTVKHGKYVIPIVVDYLNSFRQPTSIAMSAVVNVTSSSGLSGFNSTRAAEYGAYRGGGQVFLLLVVALAVICIVLGYLYWRERRAHKKTKSDKERRSHKDEAK